MQGLIIPGSKVKKGVQESKEGSQKFSGISKNVYIVWRLAFAFCANLHTAVL